MKKEIYYVYLGENGVIMSPVKLENIYHIEKCRITADKGKKLTKNNKTFTKSITISPKDLDLWHEVDDI